jgi:hypothetical protein
MLVADAQDLMTQSSSMLRPIEPELLRWSQLMRTMIAGLCHSHLVSLGSCSVANDSTRVALIGQKHGGRWGATYTIGLEGRWRASQDYIRTEVLMPPP